MKLKRKNFEEKGQIFVGFTPTVASQSFFSFAEGPDRHTADHGLPFDKILFDAVLSEVIDLTVQNYTEEVKTIDHSRGLKFVIIPTVIIQFN